MNTPSNLSDFKTIRTLIVDARNRVYQNANRELVTLYWQVGRNISEKVKEKRWGKGVIQRLSEFISDSDPDIKGFTARNLWRMKQFYETYGDDKKLSTLWTELS